MQATRSVGRVASPSSRCARRALLPFSLQKSKFEIWQRMRPNFEFWILRRRVSIGRVGRRRVVASPSSRRISIVGSQSVYIFLYFYRDVPKNNTGMPVSYATPTTLNSCIIVTCPKLWCKSLFLCALAWAACELYYTKFMYYCKPFYNIFQIVGPCGHIKGTLLQHIPKFCPLRAY